MESEKNFYNWYLIGGCMVTRDHRLDRIRITVGGFGSNEILSIQRD